MHEPKVSHGVAFKQVLRYLRGTCALGLYFKCETKRGLTGYSDSSYSVDLDDDRRMTGHIFLS